MVGLKSKYNAAVSKYESNKPQLSYDEEYGPISIGESTFKNIR